MRKAGIADYRAFASEVAARRSRTARSRSRSSPTSSPRWSARRARSPPGASNVYVKIPVTNTRREPAIRADRAALARPACKLNVTALMTLAQVRDVGRRARGRPAVLVSVFAGRIADTGRDPVPLMAAARRAACGPSRTQS